MLVRFIDEVLPAFAAAIGQAEPPHLILSQINAFTCADSGNPVVLQQYAVARNRYAQGVSLAGPMYQCQFHDPGHLTDLGRMIHGEVRAVARHYAVRLGQPWNPLWPRMETVRREGTLITLPMMLPPDAATLSLDRDWVLPVPDEGFVYSDEAGDVRIESVAIDGYDVLIRLDREPVGNGWLDYATYNQPGDFGWSAGRGQLYAESRLFPSVYAELGYAVPRTVRHYCVAFRAPVFAAAPLATPPSRRLITLAA